MSAPIGYGGVSALKVMGRLREDIQRILHQHQTEHQAEVPVADQPQQTRPAVPQRTKGEQGIVVEGLTNCLVKFSKCCTPVPGDPIVGFITRGYGVSVHRSDCPNAVAGAQRPGEKDRWIKVSWDPDSLNTYKTSLDLIAKDRPGLAMDVTTVMATAKMNILGMTVNVLPDGYTKMNLVVEVRTQSEVTTIMNKLNQVQGVYQVSRVSG